MKNRRMPKIKPMAGWVLINPEDISEVKTSSGIILLEKVNPTNILKGVIVALGKPPKGVPIQMKYMDVVIYPKGEGIPIEDDGRKYLLIKQQHIQAVL